MIYNRPYDVTRTTTHLPRTPVHVHRSVARCVRSLLAAVPGARAGQPGRPVENPQRERQAEHQQFEPEKPEGVGVGEKLRVPREVVFGVDEKPSQCVGFFRGDRPEEDVEFGRPTPKYRPLEGVAGQVKQVARPERQPRVGATQLVGEDRDGNRDRDSDEHRVCDRDSGRENIEQPARRFVDEVRELAAEQNGDGRDTPVTWALLCSV